MKQPLAPLTTFALAITTAQAIAQETVFTYPIMPDAVDIVQGEALYTETCAACHGVDAAGQEGVAPPLVHKIYEPGHHGDLSFQRAVKFGVKAHHWRFGDMAPVEGLTEGDVVMITRYVRELQRENGIF